MNTDKVITLARKHLDTPTSMASSARLCLTEAIEMRDKGELVLAKQHALKSLAYSIGTFHRDYIRAAQ